MFPGTLQLPPSWNSHFAVAPFTGHQDLKGPSPCGGGGCHFQSSNFMHMLGIHYILIK